MRRAPARRGRSAGTMNASLQAEVRAPSPCATAAAARCTRIWASSPGSRIRALVAPTGVATSRRCSGWLHWLEANTRSYFDAEGRVASVGAVLREVTRRRVVQEGEVRFRQLIEQAPAAMCIHRGLELLYANARFADLFGFESAAAVVGTPVLDLVAPELREAMALRYTCRQASLPEPANRRGAGAPGPATGAQPRAAVPWRR